MTLDLASFHRACSPDGTLLGENHEEPYYLDLSSVRGNALIEEFQRTIRLAPDKPTCQLLAAPIGSWKSQELQRLKTTLAQEGWHVVYCSAKQDLDLADVHILDVLLMLAYRVSTSLKSQCISLKSKYFSRLFQEIRLIFDFYVENSPNAQFSDGIGSLIARLKNNSQFRYQLRIYLESRTDEVLNAINQELLQAATEALKQRYSRGLVLIVDELELAENRRLASGRYQPEYLFIDQGEQLRRLNCHVVYAIPMGLMFSKGYEAIKSGLGKGLAPKVLPMVPVYQRDGSHCKQGMALLRQAVLIRAFPDVEPAQRLHLIPEIFDSPETLDRLCRISGGYVRHLLGLLYKCFWEEEPPFSRGSLERLIAEYRDGLVAAVDDHEWNLLR
ncbi:MAG TPA: ATP-binding protein, partial [Coleofasciculaceae cyanobacterium]